MEENKIMYKPPQNRLDVPNPKNDYTIEFRRGLNDDFSLYIYEKDPERPFNSERPFERNIKYEEILNDKEKCILNHFDFEDPDFERPVFLPIKNIIIYVQELVNDPNSDISKFISQHLVYDQDLRKQKAKEAEKIKEAEEAAKIKEREREEHFFDWQSIPVRTAISSSLDIITNSPVAGEVDSIVKTHRLDSGSFDTISMKDLEDRRYKMTLKMVPSGSVLVGQAILAQIIRINMEEKGKKSYTVKRTKILETNPDLEALFRVARDRIMKYYEEIGKPVLFQITVSS